MKIRCAAVALTLAALPVGAVVAGPLPAATDVRTVLAIYWSSEDFPSNAGIDPAIRRVLGSEHGMAVDYFSEFLESDRFPAVDADDALRNYIREKYRHRRIDVVVAISEVAHRFALQYRHQLFPDAPIVFSRVATPSFQELAVSAEQTGVIGGAAYRETLAMALAMHPTTREVIVVASAPSAGFNGDVKEQLEVFSGRVRFRYLTDVSVPVLLARIKSAPPDSLVLYVRYSQEDAGHLLFPQQIAAMVAEASPVPVYVTRDAYFGTGAVGGQLRSSQSIGEQTAQLALRILHGTPARNIPIQTAAVKPTIDWRQVERWHVDASRIPKKATLLFKEPTLWETYRWYLVATMMAFAAQAGLIAALLAQHRRRRRAEQTIRTREATLRKSYERIRQLNGRLITAQEAARAEIARELHDDVCQELAGVSLTVGGLKLSNGRVRDSHVQKALSQLELSVLGMLDGLRRLSHDLHPATLKLVGLAAALRSHCIEVERRHDVQVGFEAIGAVGRVNPDIALCLFRITQEALRNGAVHGEARRMMVSAVRTEHDVVLTVSDDGRGFDVEHARVEGHGLGLTSIEERVRGVGGDVQVTSIKGKGTTIRVRIPLAETADAEKNELFVKEAV